MAAQVFTFHIAYAGLEDRIWRDVEVSSRMRLDQLGYVVLAVFDTMASHLFELGFRGRIYSLPDAEAPETQPDLAGFTLEDLAPETGETLEMTYDFSIGQRFLLTHTAVRGMKRGEGRHFPWVKAMNGRGIIEDMPVGELKKLIGQIDRNGKTDEPVYYSRYGTEDDAEVDSVFVPVPWDVNRFDLKTQNRLLKYDAAEIEQAYAPFWEEKRQPEKAEPSGEALCRAFFEAVLRQDPDRLRRLFRKNAVIEWPCTDERFTLEEYIRANCEYPGDWTGEIVSVLPAAEQTVLITRVFAKDRSESFHCVSLIRRKNGRIAALTEYWSDDGPAPLWRQALGIGKPIRGKEAKP